VSSGRILSDPRLLFPFPFLCVFLSFPHDIQRQITKRHFRRFFEHLATDAVLAGHGSHGHHGDRATAKYIVAPWYNAGGRARSDGTAYTILPSRSWSVISPYAGMEVSPGKFLSSRIERRSPAVSEINANQTSVDGVPRRIERFRVMLSSRRESPIAWSIHWLDRAEIELPAATDNNYSSNVLCGLCQREHAPLGQTRHTWGRRKNSQRVKAVCKTVARSIQEPRIRRPLTRSTVYLAGRLDLRLTF